MIQPSPKVSAFEVLEKLDAREGWLSRQARAVMSWLGFFLMCLSIGGDEVRRQGKRYSHHVNTDG